MGAGTMCEEVNCTRIVHSGKALCDPCIQRRRGGGHAVSTESGTKARGEPPKGWRKDELPTVSVNEPRMTESGRLVRDVEHRTGGTSKPNAPANAPTTREISTATTRSVSNEQDGMDLTEQLQPLGDVRKIRLLDFIGGSPNSDEGPSRRKNYLDTTLTHLNALMEDLSHDPSDRKIKKDRVQEICNVAGQMRHLMRLKLDVVKAAQGDEV